MRSENIKKIETLQPGFLIITYDSLMFDDVPTTIIGQGLWKELKKKGFYGGLIKSDSIKIESIPDKDLVKMGLQRIVKGH